MAKRAKIKIDPFVIILTVLPCLFFLPELVGRSYFAGWDITRLNLPLKWYDSQVLRDGAIPLWNHYLYAGMPQLAESESGLYYPGNLLLRFPGDFFLLANLTYIFHFILAGIFMNLWLRGRGIKPFASFFGAVLFQFAPFLLFHITSMAILQSVIWFPLLLWLSDKLMSEDNTKTRSLIASILAFLGGILMTIGSAQMAFYQLFLLFWYLIGHVFASEKNHKGRISKASLGFISTIAGAVLLGAAIWIPASEFARTTVRDMAGGNFYNLGSTWLSPGKIATGFIFPAYEKQTDIVGWASSLFYIGLLPSFLALIRLTGIRKHFRDDLPLIIMGAVALFLAFGMNNPVNHALVKFAPFSYFRYQGRISIGVLIALIALGSHFLSSIGQNLKIFETRFSLPIAVGIIAVFAILFLRHFDYPKSIQIGLAIFAIDIILTANAILSLKGENARRYLPEVLTIYLLFHLVIVYPVGRLATMYSPNFNNALRVFRYIERPDGLPPKLLVASTNKFSNMDLLDFNLWTPQTEFPDLLAGNAPIFSAIRTMDPYTPLRPIEWDKIIRREILPQFSSFCIEDVSRLDMEPHVIDRKTYDSFRLLGIDAIIANQSGETIEGYHDLGVDISAGFDKYARLYVADNFKPQAWVAPLVELDEKP
ncbi:MAG: hypothetical protein ABIC40_02740, partial [bacterium]